MTRPREEPNPSELSVLFVCLGNICRSPLAEGVLAHEAHRIGLDRRLRVDSAGTGAWHVGEPPDPRSIRVAERNGVRLEGRARKVEPGDLHEFDYVFAMDRSNLHVLEGMLERSGGSARVLLLRTFDSEAGGDLDVPDPYYGGPGGFDEVFEMVTRSCRAFLNSLEDD